MILRRLLLLSFWAKLIIIFLTDRVLHFAQMFFFIFPKVVRKNSIKDAMLVFTDGFSSGRAAYVTNGKGYVVQTTPASAQKVDFEL